MVAAPATQPPLKNKQIKQGFGEGHISGFLKTKMSSKCFYFIVKFFPTSYYGRTSELETTIWTEMVVCEGSCTFLFTNRHSPPLRDSLLSILWPSNLLYSNPGFWRIRIMGEQDYHTLSGDCLVSRKSSVFHTAGWTVLMPVLECFQGQAEVYQTALLLS